MAAGTHNGVDPRDRRIAELERQIERRDQVIGELTIAIRVLKRSAGPVTMTAEVRQTIIAELTAEGWLAPPRCTEALGHLGIATSGWYRPDSPERKRPGPAPKPTPQETVDAVIAMATDNPRYGYKRIAVMCRRAGHVVRDRVAYTVMRRHHLLHRRPSRAAEVYQAARLFELLPPQPGDLWQMDVTYIHIPGHGWWYAVTVIDYFSRYLLGCYLTDSYSALEVAHGLELARAEAERIHGPLPKRPFLVTDNGPSFVARRFADLVREAYSHVRIRYRTPQQLGLLERFHETLKAEEVHWRLYEDPEHARRCLAEFRARYNASRPHEYSHKTGPKNST